MLAEKKHIHVDLEAVDDVTVSGDTVRLRQLVLNLLDNAIKYTPEKGTIALSLVRENGSAKIIVKDNGRSREMGGTGLGLSIAQWITETHGGSIFVKSEVNKGSVFTVVLPLVSE